MGQYNSPPDLLKQLSDMRAQVKALQIGTPRLYSEVLTAQSTASTSPVDLGGPSVTIQVPSAAFVSMYAQAELVSSVASLQAYMYLEEENGDFGPALLLSNGNVWDTRGTVPVDHSMIPSGGHVPLVGPLTFPASEGTRTYSLRYAADSGCTATFRNRKLWVWTIG